MYTIFHFFILFILSLNINAYPGSQSQNSNFSSQYSTVEIGDKHIIILSSDHEFMWGSYYFGVHNKSASKEFFTCPVMLPEHTIDFKTQQGLTENEIILDNNKRVSINKEFPPGLSLISLAFKLPLSQWDTQSLTLKSPYPIAELSIASMKELNISFQDIHAIPTIPNMLNPEQYSGITYKNIKKDQTIHFEVLGLPSGNGLSWVIASLCFACLIVFAAILIIKDTKIRDV